MYDGGGNPSFMIVNELLRLQNTMELHPFFSVRQMPPDRGQGNLHWIHGQAVHMSVLQACDGHLSLTYPPKLKGPS
jgi:hypothetical protein